MKILKVEDHNYKIIYINNNGHYNVYKRLSKTEWEEFSSRRNKWIKVDDVIKLEKAFKTV